MDDDAGAVTIDWVALTSGVLLVGIMVVYSIFNGGVASLTSNINATLSGNADPGSGPENGGDVMDDYENMHRQ